MKTFHFNKIIILQSINPCDSSQKLLCEPGPYLKTEIDKKLAELKANDNSYKDVVCELKFINSIDEWQNEWTKIVEDCANGIKPIIHIVSHGSKEALYINNNGTALPILWMDVYSVLEKANIACHNNIFVTMCVCYGFHSLKRLLKDQHRIPFVGILASPDTVHVYDAKVRFTDFYLSLITGRDVYEAMKLVLDDINKVWSVIGSKPNDLIIKFADDLFVENFKEVYNLRQDPNYLKREAIMSLWSSGLPVSENIIQLYVEEYNKRIPEIYQKMVDNKFMFDLYPEERQRFDIPSNLKDLMK